MTAGDLGRPAGPPPAPEMRGDWDGMRERTGRTHLDPDGTSRPIYVSVCPSCAKGLYHTKREHDALEHAALTTSTKGPARARPVHR